MKKTAKILITGYFGMDNLGDDLLFAEALCKLPSKYKIYVNTPPASVIKGKKVIPSANIEKFRYIRNFHVFTNRWKIFAHSYAGLLYFGGGLFPSRSFSLRNLLSNMQLGLTCKKRIICGCGIVPKDESRYFQKFLQTVDYCSVRDEISRTYVENLGCRAVNCGDLYWGNNNEPLNVERKAGTCLICLANPYGENELNNKATRQRYNTFLSSLSKVISAIKSAGFVVEYMAFFHLSDEVLIEDLQQLMGTEDKVLRYGTDYTIESVNSLFARYEIGFCMRFHSILLSIKNCLPFISINYDYKSEMLLKEAGLEVYGVRYGIRKAQFFGEEIELDEQLLLSKFKTMLGDKSLIKRKFLVFREKKHRDIKENYNTIFKLLDNDCKK